MTGAVFDGPTVLICLVTFIVLTKATNVSEPLVIVVAGVAGILIRTSGIVP